MSEVAVGPLEPLTCFSAWDLLEAAAVLGTGQESPVRPDVGAAQGFSAQLNRLDSESRLLTLSVVEWAYQAAGREPMMFGAPLPSPAPELDATAASHRAGEHLQVLLTEHRGRSLGEWIEVAVRGGFRAPDRLLPVLLDFLREHRRWRSEGVRVLGERGRWLARLNPEWSFIAGAGDPEEFAESSHESRVLTIAALRGRDPMRARELVQAAWKEEPCQRRADLLGALLTGLSMADEPFLEGCLSERGKDVRAKAAELLSRLIGSRLCQRMKERAGPTLRFTTKTFIGLGGARIEVRLPELCNASMIRDGIEPKPPQARLGEKAWWLLQILGATPLTYWVEVWRARPGHIVEALAGNEFEETIFEGWLLAAERQRDAAWANELLLHWPPRRPDLLARSLAILPEKQREEEVCRRIEENLESGAMIHPLEALLPAMELAWGENLGRQVLKFLQRYATQDDKLDPGTLEALIAQASGRLPPALAGEVVEGWPLPEHLGSSVHRALEQLFYWVDFRAQMLTELKCADSLATSR